MKDYKNYALKLLSIRQRSEKELRKRLKEKGAPPQKVEEIISYLKKQGLLDDRDFAIEFIKSKARRHWSWYMIIKTLTQEYGVDASVVGSLWEEYPEEEVLHYYVRRFKREGKTKEKIIIFLKRKGFSSTFIKRVLEELSNIA